jgi:hypothetical protein
MSVQTAYPDTPAIGFEGMLAEQFALRLVQSGLVETAAVPLGKAVTNVGTSSDAQYVAAVNTGAVVGVAIFEGSKEFSPTAEYAVGEAFPVLSKGRYYAVAGEAIAVGDQVAQTTADLKMSNTEEATTTLFFGKAITSAALDGLFIVEVSF